ncbi:hypothetical protein IGI04_014833 [Brassica rapa subsp. trilocularis]|uniref:Uncharacterized protein n=1 Tax=Brassica rapa subsp. trilocularis TaxID=1813537 RepID=A0ABQ7MQT2_BRACM|nr:hypothetical protein IGI04_014833 [Brassica rapa subsp. trilocularis]
MSMMKITERNMLLSTKVLLCKKELSITSPEQRKQNRSTAIAHHRSTLIPHRHPRRPRRAMDGRVLQISREDIADICEMANGPDNLFLQQRRDSEYQHMVIDELFGTACVPPLIDDCLEFGRRAYNQNRQRRFHCKKRDECVVYRDDHGYARVVDGRGIHVSKEDIRAILERATMHERSYICLPEHAEGYTQSMPEPYTYNKEEVDERRLDDVYYPFDNSISWWTTHTDKMKQDIAPIQQQQTTRTRASKLIDGDTQKSIDSRLALFEERLQSFVDSLDKVNFSQDLMKEKINQELKDISE